MNLLYALTVAFSVLVIVKAAYAMGKLPSLSVQGEVGPSFVAAAGFFAVPFLNVATALWLCYEITNPTKAPHEQS